MSIVVLLIRFMQPFKTIPNKSDFSSFQATLQRAFLYSSRATSRVPSVIRAQTVVSAREAKAGIHDDPIKQGGKLLHQLSEPSRLHQFECVQRRIPGRHDPEAWTPKMVYVRCRL